MTNTSWVALPRSAVLGRHLTKRNPGGASLKRREKVREKVFARFMAGSPDRAMKGGFPRAAGFKIPTHIPNQETRAARRLRHPLNAALANPKPPSMIELGSGTATLPKLSVAICQFGELPSVLG